MTGCSRRRVFSLGGSLLLGAFAARAESSEVCDRHGDFKAQERQRDCNDAIIEAKEPKQKSARLYYMGCYHLGSRDDRLLARLKELGVKDPAKEPVE